MIFARTTTPWASVCERATVSSSACSLSSNSIRIGVFHPIPNLPHRFAFLLLDTRFRRAVLRVVESQTPTDSKHPSHPDGRVHVVRTRDVDVPRIREIFFIER